MYKSVSSKFSHDEEKFRFSAETRSSANEKQRKREFAAGILLRQAADLWGKRGFCPTIRVLAQQSSAELLTL